MLGRKRRLYNVDHDLFRSRFTSTLRADTCVHIWLLTNTETANTHTQSNWHLHGHTEFSKHTTEYESEPDEATKQNDLLAQRFVHFVQVNELKYVDLDAPGVCRIFTEYRWAKKPDVVLCQCWWFTDSSTNWNIYKPKYVAHRLYLCCDFVQILNPDVNMQYTVLCCTK